MLKTENLKILSSISLFRILLVAALFSCSLNLQAQVVNAEIDTTAIKIGEQIKYQVHVEDIGNELVVFPEGQTFAPMEVVESPEIDTLQKQNKRKLLKEYFLTKFDSGRYVIPSQKILVGDRSFQTDSFAVEVQDVVVDTTKQKMFPIKPDSEVSGGLQIPDWVWWLLAILGLAGLVAYFIIRRKAKKDAEPELPPYEQAMVYLQELDKSELLDNRNTKEYYSQLSFAARRYLDRKINDRGLEMTTGELIDYLRKEKEAGRLDLSDETIEDFRKMLQRADLAKFANSRPDILTAKEDRSKTGKIIDDLRASVPEPTEEELLQDEVYRQEVERRKRKKRIILGVIAGVLVIMIGITTLIATKGITYVMDTYLGHPTKELLEGEWIRSEYGNPAVTVTTPKVLLRKDMELPPEVQRMMIGSETFQYGSLLSNFYVSLSTMKFKGEVKFDMKKAIDGIYTNLESQGAKNIVMKQEEFSTINGAKGMKVFGTLNAINPMTDENIPNEYVILNFAVNGGFEQVMVIYNADDTYAREIADRITDSVELLNSDS